MPGATDDRREVRPADAEVSELAVIEQRKLMGKPRSPAAFAKPRGKPHPP